MEGCSSETPEDAKTTQLLAKGILETYEPPLATIRTHLKELTKFENTHSKIRHEVFNNDVRKKYSLVSPPPIVGITPKQVDAADDGDSDDSTKTLVLKQEPVDLDEIAEAPLECVAANDDLLIKQEPNTQLLINTNNNLPTLTNLKKEPQDLHENNEHVLQNAEIFSAIAESETAIDDLLNNLNYCDMEIKHESMDTHDDNSKEIDQTQNDAYIITNEKKNSSISPIENCSKSVENHDVIETPTNNKHEIIWELSNTSDQTDRNKEILSKNNASQPSYRSYQVNHYTGPAVYNIVNDSETSISPKIFMNHIKIKATHNDAKAEKCKVVHIKNLPIATVMTEGDMLNLIRKVLLKREIFTYKNSISVLVHVLQDEIEHKLLGEALVKFKTHSEALRACELLNGMQILGETIEVKLDIGHIIVKENMNFIDCRTMPEWLKRRRDATQDEDGPPAKESKEDQLIRRKYVPPTELSSDNYGFKPNYLRNNRLPEPLSNVIFVDELHQLVNEEKLREVFSMAGDIRTLQFFKDKRKAIIEYDHPLDAMQALRMFRNQKLYKKKIIMRMEPAAVMIGTLPEGLSGINHGFAINGEPLTNVRTIMELRNIHEQLYELGKMNKFNYKHLTAPFNVWYGKCTNNEHFTRKNSLNASNITPDVIPPPINNFYQNSQSNTDSNAIEALGAILKSQGVIPAATDCNDLKNLLAALAVNVQNHLSYGFSNSLPTTSSLNNMYMSPNNAVNHTAYVTQNFPQGVPTHGNVPQSFVQGGPKVTQGFAHGAQEPMAKPDSTMIYPNTSKPSLNWEQSSNFPHKNNSNYINEEAKRREDYPRDPRVVFPNEARVLFKNLPPSINQTVLCKKMCTVGEVLYCKVAASTAIVAFKTSRDADRCFQLFNQIKIDGNIIEVICV